MTTEAWKATEVRNYEAGAWQIPAVDPIDTIDPATGDTRKKVFTSSWA